MKRLLTVCILACGLFFNSRVLVLAESAYVIENFESEIRLEEKQTLLVEERIVVNFLTQRRGIIRFIPWQYSAKGRTINSNLFIESVKDEKGKNWNYQLGREDQNISIKIGEENKYLSGRHVYVIRYRVEDVVLDYGEGPEIYWNVTGHEWDAPIEKTEARVISEYGKIEKIDCLAGVFGSNSRMCEEEKRNNEAVFRSEAVLGQGSEMTVVVQIAKDNKLVGLSQGEKLWRIVRDNWGYVVALLPFLLMLYFWWKKGRDRRFLNDNVFYVQEGAKERSTKLFEKESLSTVYQKIEGLSPAQVGMIIDEKVDLNDIVAELVDLARRGFVRIEKIEKKGIFSKVDYKLVGTGEGKGELEDYQKYLLLNIFGNITETENMVEIIKDSIADKGVTSNFNLSIMGQEIDLKEMFSKEKDKEGKERREKKKVVIKGEKKISELKNNFYTHLPTLAKKIEESLVDKKCFSEKPAKTKQKWIGIAMLMNVVAGVGISVFMMNTYNPGPIFLLIVTGIASVLLSAKMVAKTAIGYNYYRQAASLKWFIEKGKWREEIAEKRLFLSEILPLAIALGVVKKLAKEMEDLGVGSPDYVGSGMILSRDVDLFSRSMVNAMATAPGGSSYSSSGRSSWSGGSGFSGGSSGGGFGGGGGSSW